MEERPSVLMVAPYGTASYIVDWAHAISSFADVLVLTFNRDETSGWRPIGPRVSMKRDGDIPFVWVTVPKVRPSRFFWRLNFKLQAREILRALALVQTEFGCPDVIHGHFYAIAEPLLWTAKKLGSRYVHTEHASALISSARSPTQVGERMVERMLAESDVVLAVSKDVKQALMKRAEREIRVVPNPVNDRAFLLSGSPSEHEPLKIVSVGRVTREKGHPLLLEAFDRVRSTVRRTLMLQIVGDGPLLEELKSQIAELGLENVVELSGRVPRSEIGAILANAHIYAHASEVETFSVSLVEAQMSGLPAVTVKSGGVTTLEEWQGESVNSNSVGDFTAALCHTIRRIDSFDRSAIAKNARARFGIGVVSETLETVYRDVLREHK